MYADLQSNTTCRYNQVYYGQRPCPPSCGNTDRKCNNKAGCACPTDLPYDIRGFCEASCPGNKTNIFITDRVVKYGMVINLILHEAWERVKISKFNV